MKDIIKNKHGMELAMSTVITIIILIIVLVVVVTFFLGGTGMIFNPLAALANNSSSSLIGIDIVPGQ